MGFDVKAFMSAQFEPRTAQVRVPGLAEFFPDSEPLWTVRGQTANEIARAADAAGGKHKSIDAIIRAIGKNAEKIAELRSAIGVADDDVPGEIVKRLEQLVSCSVDPAVDLPLAVRLAEVRPIEFYILSNEITRLTGLGMDIKKPLPSGSKSKSEIA